jgi:PAS domain S-box-containing protein
MTPPSQPRSISWVVLPIILAIATVVGIIAATQYEDQRRALRAAQAEHLVGIADAKARLVADWRQRRLDDALVVSQNPFLGPQLRRFFLSPTPAAESAHLIWMASLKKHYGYYGIDLVDNTGIVRLSYGDRPTRRSVLPDSREAVAKALASHELRVSDLYKDRASGLAVLDVTVPVVVVEMGERRLAGLIVLTSDPRATLYEQLKAWPTESATAETVLLRRDGDAVVYLNELRHRASPPFGISKPTNTPGLLEARAVDGIEGVADGVDYRGVRVRGAARRVQGSPWYVVAKMDRAEMQAPIRDRALLTAIMAGMLVLLGALIVGAVSRRRNLQAVVQQCEVDRDERDTAQRYNLLMQYAHDIIIILDETGRVVDANERALQAYGYTRDEILQHYARDLRVDETETGNILLTEVGRPDGALFETHHRRRDDITFPVEVSSRMAVVQGAAFYLCIMRDITERTEAARALEEERERLAVTVHNIGDGVITLDARGWITLMNDVAADLTGCASADAVGRPLDEFYRTDEPAGQMGEHGAVATLRAGGTVGPSTHVTLTTCDGAATRRVAQRVSPIHDSRGRIIGGVLVFHG